MGASAAGKKRKQLAEAENYWLPDIDRYTQQYFDQLKGYTPKAAELADMTADADFKRATRLREAALPGITEGTKRAGEALFPLLRGELPPSILDAYTRAGAANSVGTGFGGSGFGFLNTGLFGARGALGAMQTGYGLLPALMASLPNINSPSTATFLEAIMTPAQRTQTQMQIRGQNLGLRQAVAGMPTSGEVWGQGMQQMGGVLLGGAMGGGGGMMGGGGSSSIMSTGFGPTGNWATPTTPSYSGLTGANRLY